MFMFVCLRIPSILILLIGISTIKEEQEQKEIQEQGLMG